jgi:peptidoglycan/LPS O-acetylase OafA/YrhL
MQHKTSHQSNTLRVLASIGVVVLHLQGSKFYIGDHIHFHDVQSFMSDHGPLKTALELFRGISAMVGIFFISSGYGLAKSPQRTYSVHLKKRFIKVYLYAVLCAVLCSFIGFTLSSNFSFNWIYSILPVFGFYEMPRNANTIQYWFLSCLFSYYILFPLFNKASSTMLTCLMAACYLLSVPVTTGYMSIPVSIYHSTFFRLPEFLLGILVARSPALEQFFFRPDFRAFIAGTSLFSIGYLCAYSPYTYPISLLFMSVGSFAIVSYVANTLLKQQKTRQAMAVLAAGTLTLYLLHMATARYIYEYATDQLRSLTGNIFVLFTVDLTILLILCLALLLLGRFVEERYHSWVKL